jgi:CheY-like chemotaxis protein
MSVTDCASGQDALSKVKQHTYDAILLDVMMPSMDGPTTLKLIQELPNGATTPIVFLTAKVLPAEISRLTTLSNYEVISKPFDPLTLSDQLLKILGKTNE